MKLVSRAILTVPTTRYGVFYRAGMIGIALCSLILIGCGGGGGGDNFSGAAYVSLDASPNEIDVGDQIRIRIFISDLHEDGISLKIRYPSDLSYVPNSAMLRISGDEIDVTPAVNANSGKFTFLVFYLSHDTFGDETGELWIELEGDDRNENASIEVDPDVDNPDISNEVEFDIESPEFSAEDETSVSIRS